jgi:hypothetical protein
VQAVFREAGPVGLKMEKSVDDRGAMVGAGARVC